MVCREPPLSVISNERLRGTYTATCSFWGELYMGFAEDKTAAMKAYKERLQDEKKAFMVSKRQPH